MNSPSTASRYFAIVPAAGVGKRVGADKPKQYLQLRGKTILEHTLLLLLDMEELRRIIVAVGSDDDYWQELAVFSDPRVDVIQGGTERSDSVFNGLVALADSCQKEDWVLVHDVARPCVLVDDIRQLMTQLADHSVGGLLAVPASDTMKRVANGNVEATIDRSLLWHAQTPQMFRYQLLHDALLNARNKGLVVTDESSAIEMQGLKPCVIEGSRCNIKVTRPEDVALADYYLKANKNL